MSDIRKFIDENFIKEQKVYAMDHEEMIKKISDGKRFYGFNLRGDNLSSENPHIQGILDKIHIELIKVDEEEVKEGEERIWEKEEWKENFLEVGYWGDEYGNFLELDGIGFICELNSNYPNEYPFPLYEIEPIKIIPLPFEDGLELLEGIKEEE
jgi:hypothetical protein